ncbi:hypothetical protein HG536_0G04400 [Torulaspora globosa]|uniref:Glucose-signaling factor 2 n=1 Tax=Torulaspora globosa TaxID=48254 RepID=A0A7G3ZM42_9SACH|nr:uncharacterized protein HG536_0G04400 [Torulaspora globosa]QLL34578.1 hypothetical protein HG536_0G04400 [Torulaspora globosa]
MEIYVRLNNDVERDFAFQIDTNDTINTKIAKSFRQGGDGVSDFIVLRPTIFHEKQPIGYYKSLHPGYLTEGGCLIFDYDADLQEYKQRLDPDKKLIDQLWPGQLILPEWKKSTKNIVTYVIFMLIWLYTDLPDVISPTPGICLTNQLSRIAIPIFEHFGKHSIADKLREEIQVNFSGVIAQWGFFVIHILKIAFITMFFTTGMVNPISFNPAVLYKIRNLQLTGPKIKNLLRSLGWVGAKRGTYDEYQSNFYEYIIKKYGDPGKAFKAGMIRVAAAPGLRLGDGEGFQTPLDQRFSGYTFKTIKEEGKFVLSEEYYLQLENDLKKNLESCQGDIGQMNNEIRRFRRFGLYEPGEELKEMVRLRKEVKAREEAEKAKKAEESKKEK